MKKFYKNCVCLLLALPIMKANAQKVDFVAEAGVGLAYVNAKNVTGIKYASKPAANVSFSIVATISKSINFETGLQYVQKGYDSKKQVVAQDDATRKSVYDIKAVRDYVSVPLVVSFKVLDRPDSKLWVGAGMSYGFLARSKNAVTVDYYKNDKQYHTSQYDTHPKVGFVQSYGDGSHAIDIYGFDPALRFQVRYIWHSQYTFRLFHEMSLQDADAHTKANGTQKMQYTGVSIGYTF